MDANLTIVMTYKGLKALGLPQSSLDSFPENFKAGMAGRSDILGDKGDNDLATGLRHLVIKAIFIFAAR